MVEQTADEDIAGLRLQMGEKDKEIAAARAMAANNGAELEKARATATQAVNDRVAADEIALRSAIAAADTTIGALKTEYAAALEKSDFAAVADINAKMVENSSGLSGYKRQLSQIDWWKKQQLAEIERMTKNPPVNPDPLAQYDGTPKTKAWLVGHMDIVSDPKKMNKARAAHYDALGEGLVFESPEYFEYVEGRVLPAAASSAATVDEPGASTVNKADGIVVDTIPPVRQEQRRAPTDQAAAPSRQTPEVGRKERPGTVRLSAAEIEAANFSFPNLKTPEERQIAYAQNKAALQQEGRL